jgi:hypothetical protein
MTTSGGCGSRNHDVAHLDRPDVVSSEALVTQVWRRTPWGWQHSHFHACRAPQPAAAASLPG